MKLIGIGDNVVDYYQDQGLMYPGGNALNVAVASRRSGALAAAYLGIVGSDAASDHILACLQRERIGTERIRRVCGPSGEARVSLNEDGDRVFLGTNREVRVQSLLALRLTPQDLGYIDGFDVVHASVNSEIEHELPRLAGRVISYDFSTPVKYTQEDLERICPYLTYAFFSGSGLSGEETDRLIDKVHRLGTAVVGVTRGGEPALFSERGTRFEQRPAAAHVVDTMGAGDSFIGAFLTEYHPGRDMRRALGRAAEAAAATCGLYGAFGYGIAK
ncbi:fructoselysine 6-kinase [Paenibacillus mucilaginosus]|uniref:PfkB family carbohydrate kinase n=1 Tax=Paenibacillus mucilaginosus TaxID=61624 RepID=UPI003D1E8BDF